MHQRLFCIVRWFKMHNSTKGISATAQELPATSLKVIKQTMTFVETRKTVREHALIQVSLDLVLVILQLVTSVLPW
jgi:hypothetical protein